MSVENVLFLGDSGGSTGFVFNAINAARQYDCQAILQLGDFGIWDHIEAGVHFLEDVNYALSEANMPLIFCDGNHENFDSLYSIPVSDDGFRRVRPNILHAPRGHIWEWSGISFMAMGGAHSIDGPNGIWYQNRGPLFEEDRDLGSWWPQETITPSEVAQAIENIEAYPYPIDVLISHDCPLGVDIPGIGGYPAGDENRRLLAQVCDAADPSYIFCGHFHRRHTGTYNNAIVEILADNTSSGGQAFAASLESLRGKKVPWPKKKTQSTTQTTRGLSQMEIPFQ